MNGTDAGPAGTRQATTYLGRLRELAVLFLKLGSISFGGPAAHIALIENEIVHKREWITRQQFLDMVGAANLIPGPTSTETAITVGFVRAGWAGLCVAGASFILPAALITGAFAWMYVRFGSLPQATSVLVGIKPAVLAVIVIAIWRLGKTAVKDPGMGLLGMLALAAFFFDVNPILILFGGGLLGIVAMQASGLCAGALSAAMPGRNWFRSSLRFAGYAASGSIAAGTLALRPSTSQIGLFFLKVGSVLYGGGYVLLAFLEQGLVHQHAWLTRQQFAGRGCNRAIHTGPRTVDGDIHRIYFGRRSGSRSRNNRDLPAVVFLCCAVGARVISLTAISVDRDIPRLGKCLRSGSHGGGDGSPWD